MHTEKPTHPTEHPFLEQPHRTILALSIPATLSLIAEPITGLVDTAFVAQLGAEPLAAVGIGTAALSLVFWIFNFLSVGTQTEVARALGNDELPRAANMTSLALILGVFFSLVMAVLFIPGASIMANLLGAAGDVQREATLYMHIRLWGAPAVLLTLIGMGALRGLQDMRTPLYIAGSVNVLNIVLDAPLIFGWGAIPALGVGGSALATVISQWIGALWLVWHIRRELGLVWYTRWSDIRDLLQVGGDLFVRTALLNIFLLAATRVANQISPDAGAAHQAIRTVWMFTALAMEGFAMTAQSLVGYFAGAKRPHLALEAATLNTYWSLGLGIGLIVLMIGTMDIVQALLVPDTAIPAFRIAWVVAALSQPFAALAFITDGIHWGTSDYTFLRNAMLIATAAGIGCLMLIDTTIATQFVYVWAATGVWLAVRGIIGILRVYPGIGRSPLRTIASVDTA